MNFLKFHVPILIIPNVKGLDTNENSHFAFTFVGSPLENIIIIIILILHDDIPIEIEKMNK